MFTIDLLKGQAIPIKSKPGGIAVMAGAVAIPVVAVIILVNSYLTGSVALGVGKQQIVSYSNQTEKLTDAVAMQKSFAEEKNAQYGCLSAVSANIGRHLQWTPILVTVVESMPDTMVITALEVKRESARIPMPKKDDPTKMVDTSVIVKKMLISVTGERSKNHNEAVKRFCERMRNSEVLGPMIDKISVNQKNNKNKGKEELSYEIDCAFKPDLL
ncbi:MAG: hypothetical protein ACYSWP_02445 [Planctomycetota bacterium]|jgi:hypothetical protein